MTTEELEMFKELWAFMIVHGTITTGNYYAGDWEPDYSYGGLVGPQSNLIELVKAHGINFEKSDIPEYGIERAFEDSDCPGEKVETMIGTLVLNNGASFTVGVIDFDEIVLAIEKRLKSLEAGRTEKSPSKLAYEKVFGSPQ